MATFALPEHIELAMIPVVLAFAINVWLSIHVGLSRKKYGVNYPDMYANPHAVAPAAKPEEADNDISDSAGTNLHSPILNSHVISVEDANAFNSIQRAHQNFLEALPITLALIGTVALYHPMLAFITGTIWCASRVIYSLGYFKNPDARVPGALIGSLCQFVLFFALIYFVYCEHFTSA